jgi:outer membrane murein-binding lipoprotein Lpp
MINAILARLWNYAAWISAFFAFVIGIYMKGRADAKAKAKEAQMQREAKAKEERLEMNREATEAERKAAGMTDEEAKKEAMKWAKPR